MDPTLWLQAENPDKRVEPEVDIMKMLLECVILLCQRRGIREELRKRKVSVFRDRMRGSFVIRDCVCCDLQSIIQFSVFTDSFLCRCTMCAATSTTSARSKLSMR